MRRRNLIRPLIITLALCIGTSSVSLLAQALDTLIQQAVEQNKELKVLEKEYLAALERAPQVSGRPDLQFGVGFFALPIETRLGAQLSRASVTQPFLWKGVREGKKELELTKAKALYERLGASVLDITYQIKQAYFQLFEMDQRQLILQEKIELLHSLERLALAKVESGKASMADVLRVQLKLEAMKQQVVILETAKKRPSISINQLLHRPLDTPILISEDLEFATLSFDKKTLLENIQAEHPLLRIYHLQQAMAQQRIQLNTLAQKPSFGLGLDYMLVNKRSDADPIGNGRDIVQVRASIKIPIYRKKYEAKGREEALRIAAIDEQKAETLSRFMASIEHAYTDYEMAKLKVDLFQKQRKITQSAIGILETTYSVEGKNFDDLLKLEQELIDYDLSILKMIIQSHLAKSQIELFLFS